MKACCHLYENIKTLIRLRCFSLLMCFHKMHKVIDNFNYVNMHSFFFLYFNKGCSTLHRVPLCVCSDAPCPPGVAPPSPPTSSSSRRPCPVTERVPPHDDDDRPSFKVHNVSLFEMDGCEPRRGGGLVADCRIPQDRHPAAARRAAARTVGTHQ